MTISGQPEAHPQPEGYPSHSVGGQRGRASSACCYHGRIGSQIEGHPRIGHGGRQVQAYRCHSACAQSREGPVLPSAGRRPVGAFGCEVTYRGLFVPCRSHSIVYSYKQACIHRQAIYEERGKVAYLAHLADSPRLTTVAPQCLLCILARVSRVLNILRVVGPCLDS